MSGGTIGLGMWRPPHGSQLAAVLAGDGASGTVSLVAALGRAVPPRIPRRKRQPPATTRTLFGLGDQGHAHSASRITKSQEENVAPCSAPGTPQPVVPQNYLGGAVNLLLTCGCAGSIFPTHGKKGHAGAAPAESASATRSTTEAARQAPACVLPSQVGQYRDRA